MRNRSLQRLGRHRAPRPAFIRIAAECGIRIINPSGTTTHLDAPNANVKLFSVVHWSHRWHAVCFPSCKAVPVQTKNKYIRPTFSVLTNSSIPATHGHLLDDHNTRLSVDLYGPRLKSATNIMHPRPKRQWCSRHAPTLWIQVRT